MDKVTRQCPQTTTLFEEKGEPKRYRTEVLPLTSLTPYRWAQPAHEKTLPPCTRSGIVQAASAVHLTAVVVCGPAYVSLEQAVLHCCEPSAIDFSVSAGRPATPSCSNQGGRLSKRRQVLQKCV